VIEDGHRITRHMMIKGEVNAHKPAANINNLSPYIIQDRTLFSHVMRDDLGRPIIFVVRRLSPNVVAIGELGTNIVVNYQKAIAFGRGGHAAVVDRLGNIIAHPNKAWREKIMNIAKVKPVVKMMAGETGVTPFYSPAVKKDMITAFTTVPSTGWGVMVPQPMEELEERANDVRRIALALIGFGLLVAGILSWLLSGLLVRPVDAVVQTARGIADGNLEARVPNPPRFAPAECPPMRPQTRRFEVGTGGA